MFSGVWIFLKSVLIRVMRHLFPSILPCSPEINALIPLFPKTHQREATIWGTKINFFQWGNLMIEYSAACRKVLIFSCSAWIFHFFHATKPPNSREFCMELAGITQEISCELREIFSRNSRMVTRDAYVCCIYLKIDLFKKILRVKLPIPLCCRKSCVDHAWILHVSRMRSSIFRAFTRVTLAKEN